MLFQDEFLRVNWLIVFLLAGCISACKPEADKVGTRKDVLVRILGDEEYDRLMELSSYEFDQSANGFRKYAENYELVRLLIPEYISVNQISDNDSGNLHWHLGQLHAFEGHYEAAIAEMRLSVSESSSAAWKLYVNGTIAFLEKDRVELLKAFEALKNQEDPMNIEFLEKFIKYINKSYSEAYKSEP